MDLFLFIELHFPPHYMILENQNIIFEKFAKH